MYPKKILKVSALLIVLLSGCMHSHEKNSNVKTEHELYNEAIVLLGQKKYKAAIKNFDEIEALYPFSYWATKGQLMSAISSYNLGNYTNSVFYLDNYIQSHPNQQDIEYAYFLRFSSYYAQVKDIEHDQANSYKVLELADEFIQRFPKSKHVQDVQNKKSLIRNHLAAKELFIGRFYLKHGEYVAAIKRFNNVVKSFNDTDSLPESLYRLSESYIALNQKDEARRYMILLKQFSNNYWYKASINLINNKN